MFHLPSSALRATTHVLILLLDPAMINNQVLKVFGLGDGIPADEDDCMEEDDGRVSLNGCMALRRS